MSRPPASSRRGCPARPETSPSSAGRTRRRRPAPNPHSAGQLSAVCLALEATSSRMSHSGFSWNWPPGRPALPQAIDVPSSSCSRRPRLYLPPARRRRADPPRLPTRRAGSIVGQPPPPAPAGRSCKTSWSGPSASTSGRRRSCGWPCPPGPMAAATAASSSATPSRCCRGRQAGRTSPVADGWAATPPAARSTSRRR
jgi:hypothetical protein